MSENQNNDMPKPLERPKGEMSRRQFLSYTLGGTTGFLAAGVTIPMLRFAVDPILRPKVESDWVKIIEESKVTSEPMPVKFKIKQVDGWYRSEPTMEAWVSRADDGTIFALNPTCKHLGCTVGWNNKPEYPNQYYCPCHGAHYTKEGKTLAVSPLPLDEYAVKIEDGIVYVGQLGPNQISKGS